MILFRLKADCTFVADDLDDAFYKVADHFAGLSAAPDSSSLNLEEGFISLEPERDL